MTETSRTYRLSYIGLDKYWVAQKVIFEALPFEGKEQDDRRFVQIFPWCQCTLTWRDNEAT